MHYSSLSTYKIQNCIQNGILDILKDVERHLHDSRELTFDLIPESMSSAKVIVKAYGDSVTFMVKAREYSNEPYVEIRDENSYSCNNMKTYYKRDFNDVARIVYQKLNASSQSSISVIRDDIDEIIDDLQDNVASTSNRNSIYDEITTAINELKDVRRRLER